MKTLIPLLSEENEMQTYKFEAKKCPFCDFGRGTDERERTMAFEPKEACSHTFSKIEYEGMLVGIQDLKNQINLAQRTVRAMQKVMKAQNVLQ